MPLELDQVPAELARLSPQEILVSDKALAREDVRALLDDWREVLSPQPAPMFDSQAGERKLRKLFQVAALDSFGIDSRAEAGACGALIDYVELTQKGKLPRLMPPRRFECGQAMVIDAATRRNLELVQTLSGERRGSLLSIIDRTVTGAGARLLAQRLTAPLTDVADINRRLDAVEFFVHEGDLRDRIRAALGHVPDIERALSRLSLGRGRAAGSGGDP